MTKVTTAKIKKFLSHKIPILINEGYPQKQAIAIAYSMARKKFKNNPSKDSHMSDIHKEHPPTKHKIKTFLENKIKVFQMEGYTPKQALAKATALAKKKFLSKVKNNPNEGEDDTLKVGNFAEVTFRDGSEDHILFNIVINHKDDENNPIFQKSYFLPKEGKFIKIMIHRDEISLLSALLSKLDERAKWWSETLLTLPVHTGKTKIK